MVDFPPPPEEAQRIISKLLPIISPDNSKKKYEFGSETKIEKEFIPCTALAKKINSRKMNKISTIATQTTLPKTRRTKTYVWENKNQIPFKLHILSNTQSKYDSFPYAEAFHFVKYPLIGVKKPGLHLPPHTLPCALDRYRNVRRENLREASRFGGIKKKTAEKNLADFSDDSLEEFVLPLTKRKNLAGELEFDNEAYFTPGSTKVIGRRRKKSLENSSINSINRLEEIGVLFEKFQNKKDQNIFFNNDSEELMLSEALPLDLTFNGTYIIKKNKKEKSYFKKNSIFDKKSKVLLELNVSSQSNIKRIRSTFDNIKSLLKEKNVKGIKDTSTQFSVLNAPTLVRVVSLPNLLLKEEDVVNKVDINSECDHFWGLKESLIQKAKNELSSLPNSRLNFTLAYCKSAENKKFNSDKISKNNRALEIENLKKQVKKCNEVETQTDLSYDEKQNDKLELFEENSEISKTKFELEEVEKKIQEIVKIKTVIEQESQKESANPWIKEKIFNEKSYKYVNLEILENEFGPLPPSPVDERTKEYLNFFEASSEQSLQTHKTDFFSEQFYRFQNPSISDPTGNYLSRKLEPLSSNPVSSISQFLDEELKKSFQEYSSEHKKEKSTERLTLPTEFHEAASKCKTFQKKSLTLPQENNQVSYFLPEAPVFIRGCDIPRTPNIYVSDTTRPGRLHNSKFRQNEVASNLPNCKISLSGELNPGMVGGELLRLAGGPGRGWYPRHRQHRPASIEQLDRLPHSEKGLNDFWDLSGYRKPLTLPSNITPKFFHRSPREALRRVTSLLIRGKGTSSKEKKEALSLSRFRDTIEHQSQKKGFFRNFWKRSKHSLNHQ